MFLKTNLYTQKILLHNAFEDVNVELNEALEIRLKYEKQIEFMSSWIEESNKTLADNNQDDKIIKV